MKYGIFGDVHGNLEALEAVLADMEDQQVTHPSALGIWLATMRTLRSVWRW